MKKTIVITGGSGFIGNHVARLFETVDRLLGRKEGVYMDPITFVTNHAGHDLRYARRYQIGERSQLGALTLVQGEYREDRSLVFQQLEVAL